MRYPKPTREEQFTALFNLLVSAKPPAALGGEWVETDRVLKMWDDCPAANQPALYLHQGPQHATQPTLALNKWELTATVWIYWRLDKAADGVKPATIVNGLIDAIDSAISGPRPGDLQTLGGLVYHASINGTVVFDDGLIDNQGVMLIPISLMVGV